MADKPIVARLLDEEFPDDEGELLPFPALPHVGDFFFDCRHGHNRRFRVKSVSHVLCPAGDPDPVEIQIVIAHDPDIMPPRLRRQRPSAN